MAEGHELTGEQRALLDGWLGRFTIVADCSWPLQETTVLRLAASGDVVDGTAAEWELATYREAGAALDRLLEPLEVSDAWMVDRRAKTLATIDRAAALDLVPGDDLRQLAARIADVRPCPLRLFMTHGDYQPRNWLLDGDDLRVIDLGRAQPRPWTSDLTRLRFKQFTENPVLSAAFADGLGREPSPEEAEAQVLEDISEAIGTVVWAHDIGDRDFESHGRRMVRRILTD